MTMSGTWTTTSGIWTNYVWDIDDDIWTWSNYVRDVAVHIWDVDDDVPDIVNHVPDMDLFDHEISATAQVEQLTLKRSSHDEAEGGTKGT